MFVDAFSTFEVDDAGRLTGLRTTFLIDELTTLFVLEEHGVGAFQTTLQEAERAAIGAGVLDGLSAYDYFTDLKIEGERSTFVEARTTEIHLVEGRLSATLELALPSPQVLDGRVVELALYDPTFFAAVETMVAPSLPGRLESCVAHLLKFDPSHLESTTLAALSALSREETPEDPRIGARFADRSTVRCAG